MTMAATYFEKHTRVQVTWNDAVHFDSDGKVAEDADVYYTRETVGWVVRHDRHGILLGMTHDEEDDGTIVYEMGYGIPKPYICCVKELVDL
jgi:hypothetical protein